MGCVRPSAHSTTLLVDHLMARRGLIAHPLEESVQGLDHSQHSAMYSRGEVKPSLSTAVSCQEVDCVRPSAYSTTLLVHHLMARRGLITHPFEELCPGLGAQPACRDVLKERSQALFEHRRGLGVHGLDAFASPPWARMKTNAITS